MTARFPIRRPLALAIALTLAGPAAHAARPMVVDDAGTMDVGGAKVEAGWSKSGKLRGVDGDVGYAPLQGLELELDLCRYQDRSISPKLKGRTVGGVVKWVPLQADTGLSAGLKLALARDKVDGVPDIDGQALTALLSWRFAAGPVAHLNLGRERAKAKGFAAESASTWGVGAEFPLIEGLDLTAETFGARHFSPTRQIGLRYELAQGLSLSGAVGKGEGENQANVGLSWEF